MTNRETSLLRTKRDHQHELLLKIAESIMKEGGFAALSMQALAEGMGTGISSLYRHYKSKDELCAALFRLNTDKEIEAVREALHSKGSIEERIAKGIEVFVHRALQRPKLTWAMIAEPVAPAVEAARLEYRETFATTFAEVISEALPNDKLSKQNSNLAATALIGGMAEVLVNPLTKSLSVSQITHHIVQFCLGGVEVILRNSSINQQQKHG